MKETPAAAKPAVKPELKLRDFSQSLPMALLRARESVMRHFRGMLRHFGLTEQQWRVLRALVDVTEIEITRLAEATFLLAPSLSRILKDLEAQKLIGRRISSSDQRFSLVSITDEGRALVACIGVQSEGIYGEIAQRAGSDRLAALMDLLHEIDKALSVGAAAHFERTARTGGTGPGRLRGRPRRNG
jgi:homoprotocatechuate degradation regulator HpaR